jgi:TPR repeat protein
LTRDGLGVDRNYAEAFKLFTSAANHGNTEAQRNLAGMYTEGWGVEADAAKAQEWLKKADGGKNLLPPVKPPRPPPEDKF